MLTTRQEQIPALWEKNTGENFKADHQLKLSRVTAFHLDPLWSGRVLLEAQGSWVAPGSTPNNLFPGSLQDAKSSSATNSPSEGRGEKGQSFTGGQEEVKTLNYWRAHSQGLLGPCLQTDKVYLNLTFSVKSGAGRESTPTKTALVLA